MTSLVHEQPVTTANALPTRALSAPRRLAAQGAIIEEDALPMMDIEATCVACWLDAWTAIDVHGDDATSWLQGQWTQDLLPVQEAEAAFGFLLNRKGKVLSELWVHVLPDALRIWVPQTRVEEVWARLDGHIIMEDVVLTRRADLRLLTLQGLDATAQGDALLASLADAGRDPRPEIGGVHGQGTSETAGSSDVGAGCIAIQVAMWRKAERFSVGTQHVEGVDLVFASPTSGIPMREPRVQGASDLAASSLRSQVASLLHRRGVALCEEDGWSALHTLLGRPQGGRDFDEAFLPQESGLGAQGLSFQKGCYLGQEAVVMLEHRGKPTKRLVHLHLQARDKDAWLAWCAALPTAAPEEGRGSSRADAAPQALVSDPTENLHLLCEEALVAKVRAWASVKASGATATHAQFHGAEEPASPGDDAASEADELVMIASVRSALLSKLTPDSHDQEGMEGAEGRQPWTLRFGAQALPVKLNHVRIIGTPG